MKSQGWGHLESLPPFAILTTALPLLKQRENVVESTGRFKILLQVSNMLNVFILKH